KPTTDMGIPIIKEEIRSIKARITENQKVIDGFSSYLRQAALTNAANLESVIRTISLERDRAETEIQMLERELANKERQLSELTSDRKERSLIEHLQAVLENFDTETDSKKREIIHTLMPRIVVLRKNKLQLHLATDVGGRPQPGHQGS